MAQTGETSPLSEAGVRVYSQFEENGKMLLVFSVIGMTNKTSVEIGSNDGINSNSANLYFNFGWQGLFIDGNPGASGVVRNSSASTRIHGTTNTGSFVQG